MPDNLAIMAREAIAIGPTGRRLAANILALRKKLGLNQPQLAGRMQDQGRSVHATVVSKIEQLDRRVDVDDLVALAIALDVSPNRLLLAAEGGAIHGESPGGQLITYEDGAEIELTPAVRVPLLNAWEWATGENPLLLQDEPVTKATEERLNVFRRENHPHAPEVPSRFFDKTELRKHPELVRQAAALIRSARTEGVDLALLHDFIELTAMTAVNGDPEPSSIAEGKPMPSPATAPEPQPVAAAIVTSRLGVLAGRRNDGKPPWTFIAGEVEPGEAAPFAAVREVKEETGLEARAVSEIGRRVHPKTGRTMIYIAAEPARPDDLEVFVGDTDELAEVRWLSLAEADELLPGMFEPVHQHLERELGPESEG
jgi:8-oxo-dGTP pyrophosphatase MutT (NUDIX family)/transcriptional regulator with XRE-family HTH domain